MSNTTARAYRVAALCSVTYGALLAPTMGFAKSADGASGSGGASATIEEVIVTARKRAESIMATPVIMQAITAREVQDKRITDTAQLAQVTPNLNIHYTGGTVGAYVNFRGLNNGFASTVEQSMQLVIDGASTSSGQFYMTGFLDVGQIEVLKGPQSLFYGKGASAGIVSIRAAEPTPQWETKLTAGYEFNADEFVTDGYVSGPITEDLGIRLAGTYSTMKGYFVNPNPANPHHRVPDEDRWGGRIVLRYNPGGGPLTAELKYTQFYVKGHSNNQYQSQKLCTGARPQNSALIYDNCKLDKYLQGNPLVPPFNPALLTNAFDAAGFATGSGLVLAKDGDGMESQTNLAVGSIDYAIIPGLTFSSLTSVSRFTTNYRGADYFGALPYRITAWQRNQEFSQEVRLTSDFHDSWINFMAGAYYNRGTSASRPGFELPSLPIAGLGAIGLVTDNDTVIKSRTKAVFGQVLLSPVKDIELALGVRQTHAKKYVSSLFIRNNYPAFFVPGPTGENVGRVPESARDYSENNTSPEATITYRPNTDFTAFVSYKRGYKGPGFNISCNPSCDPAFNALPPVEPVFGEKAEGFEAGVKAALLDRRLQLTASAYAYKYKNLQVSYVVLQPSGALSVRLANGADAKVQGVELGGSYQVFDSFRVNAFGNYNDSHYTSFNSAPCYGGQTAALGCNGVSQDLKGKNLEGASKWSGVLGFDYVRALGGDREIRLSSTARYSSKYFGETDRNPNSLQHGYAIVDAVLHYGPGDGRWDLALIGRNLTNKYYLTASSGAGPVTPGLVEDVFAYTDRGRQIMIQASAKF